MALCEGVAVARFTGFSDQALEFYAGLEADNSKAFWADHKAVWETQVRDPMQALLDELEDEFGPAKMFRPYRDVRFSKDKTPYKTHQTAFVGRVTGVGWYLQVDADGLLAGGGWRAHEPAEVHRFRAAVDAEPSGSQVEGVMAALTAQGFDVNGDELSRAPRGYPADHPRIDLLRCRSLMVSRRYGAPDWLGTARAADEVRAAWRAVRPLADWAGTHVAG
jgi:uncharacterized protein (TIGR02453 family)